MFGSCPALQSPLVPFSFYQYFPDWLVFLLTSRSSTSFLYSLPRTPFPNTIFYLVNSPYIHLFIYYFIKYLLDTISVPGLGTGDTFISETSKVTVILPLTLHWVLLCHLLCVPWVVNCHLYLIKGACIIICIFGIFPSVIFILVEEILHVFLPAFGHFYILLKTIYQSHF